MNKNKRISFHKASIGDEEIQEVTEAIKSGWLTMGPRTKEFEEKFKEFIGCEYAISVNSATAALHLSLKAIDLQADDEVIVPTNTFVATAEVVTYFSAKPVLCDIEYSTHNIDVEKIEALITPKTRAIMPVHYGGQPCDMQQIFDIVQKYENEYNQKIYIIEDAAHALPSYYDGKLIGTLSDFTCFSFYATKTLATGEGGMVTTNNKKFYEHIRTNRLHGISQDVWNRYEGGDWFYDVIHSGNKYNMTDMNAALGLVQLKKLETLNEKREKIAKKYDLAFKDKIEVLKIKENRKTSNHLYVIKVSNRDDLYKQLKADGVFTSVHFIPIHFHSYFKDNFGYKYDDYSIANKVFSESLSLPIYPDMTDEEINTVIQKVLQYAK